MKRKSVFLGAAFCLLSAYGSPLWAGETGLTTLDWCPYTCAAASDGGVTTQTLRRLLGDEGDTLKVEFLPWQRAVATAEEGGGALGYFPEYPNAGDAFILSRPIGESPLGLAHRRDAPVVADLDRLAKLRVGVVSGYVNGALIDGAIRDGKIKPDEAKDDATNLRKLAAGRIDAAVIDQHVMAHLLRTDAELKNVAGKIVFGPVIERLTLHVAFNKSPAGRAAAARLDRRIAAVDSVQLQNQLFASLSNQ